MKPTKRTIKGEVYRLCVLSVDETDDHGRPRRLTLHREDEEIDVRQRNVFITAFIHEQSLIPTTN